MPEPLVCEGSDLAQLLATVHGQPGARILYQDTVRRGGMLGFFAREIHRIAYDVPVAGEPEQELLPSYSTIEACSIEVDADDDAGSTFADLLASTDAIESAVNSGSDAASPEFAELLRKLTTMPDLPFDSSDSTTYQAEPSWPESLASVPAMTEQPMGVVTPFARPDARNRLELLMQLRQVGVPVSVNPRGEAHSVYQALEDILQELPPPAQPPRQAGQVLAIVGDSTSAIRAARACAALLRIPEDTIGVAGLAPESTVGTEFSYVSGVQEALRLRRELSQADTPSIVVIATDATAIDPQDPWAREMLAALRPTAAWAVVDARWKTEDSRAYLDRLGGVDALVVHAAELSTSPASVWDLDLPLGLLDGRTPTTFAWTGLLCRLLAPDARHRASA
ncbi:MAG: hypothetical protein M3Y42_19680 [Actinomycetota bacterium]|nr:hypothetical protein [Actinomycetota bacterium]MDQ2959165.1 hypothetical protein [Actinomycetota bacterium]